MYFKIKTVFTDSDGGVMTSVLPKAVSDEITACFFGCLWHPGHPSPQIHTSLASTLTAHDYLNFQNLIPDFLLLQQIASETTRDIILFFHESTLLLYTSRLSKKLQSTNTIVL